MNNPRELFSGRRFPLLLLVVTLGVVFLLVVFRDALLELAALAVAGRILWVCAFGRSRRRPGRTLELAFGLVESVSLAMIARNTRPAPRLRRKRRLLVPYDMRRPPRPPVVGPGDLPEEF